MNNHVVQVRMLGKLSITYGDVRLSSDDNRSRQIWLLLAYLIFNRHRMVPREELLRLTEIDDTEDPAHALRSARYRARRVLQPIADVVGKELLIGKGGAFGWNPEVDAVVDAEEFERLCKAETTDEAERLQNYRRAIALWQGEFLEQLSDKRWPNMVGVRLHNLYLELVCGVLPLLEGEGNTKEIVLLCRAVLQTDPYYEPVYRQLMLSLAAQGDHQGAIEAYDKLRETLNAEMGVMPSEETRVIFQDILHRIDGSVLTPDMIQGQLHEGEFSGRAMVCDYATFRFYYQVEARSAARRGDAVHIAVLSVTDKEGGKLPAKSLERSMRELREQIQLNLRISDVAARCSVSQYVLMLVQTNYENSELVLDRLRNAFAKAHPRSPARINGAVLPIEPIGLHTPEKLIRQNDR